MSKTDQKLCVCTAETRVGPSHPHVPDDGVCKQVQGRYEKFQWNVNAREDLEKPGNLKAPANPDTHSSAEWTPYWLEVSEYNL